MKKNSVNLLVLLLLIIAGTVSMIIVTPNDYDWTKYLNEHNIKELTSFMADSIFEGERVGGGDFAVFFMIIVAILYLLAWTKEIKSEKAQKILSPIFKLFEKAPKFSKKLSAWRPYLGFIAISSFTCALYLVHTFKWSTGRPRPRVVFKGKEPFSEWYENGSHFLAEGIYHGAFPSGHTATAFSFMALAYVLYCTGKNKGRKLYGGLVGLFAIAMGGLMTISRSMSAAHWVSDSIFSIFAGWSLMHILFFWGVRVPKQEEYFNETGKTFPLPLFYELRLALNLLFASIGVIAAYNGLRALALDLYPWLISITPVGIGILFFCILRLKKLGFFCRNLSPKR